MPQQTTAPRVLVSDALSETAVQIFRDRGIEVDYMPDLGKDKEKLAEVIGQYDGLAIRSATKVTAKLLEAATNLKVIGRAGIGVDNVDIPAASKKGVIVMNTPFGNSVTTAEHAIALMFAVARQLPEQRLEPAAVEAGRRHARRRRQHDAPRLERLGRGERDLEGLVARLARRRRQRGEHAGHDHAEHEGRRHRAPPLAQPR